MGLGSGSWLGVWGQGWGWDDRGRVGVMVRGWGYRVRVVGSQ